MMKQFFKKVENDGKQRCITIALFLSINIVSIADTFKSKNTFSFIESYTKYPMYTSHNCFCSKLGLHRKHPQQ